MATFHESIEKTNKIYNTLVTNDHFLELYQTIDSVKKHLDIREEITGEKIGLGKFTPSPFFITQKNYIALSDVSKKINAIVENILTAWLDGDEKLREFFNVHPSVAALIIKQYSQWQSYSRYDFIINSEEQIKLNEINAASPGFLVFAGDVNRLARQWINTNYHNEKPHAQTMESKFSCLNIVETIEKQANVIPKTIAILYDDHYLFFELYELKKRFNDAGRAAIVAHIKECQYRNGKLYINNEEISTVFNNFFLQGEKLNLNVIGNWQIFPFDSKAHPYYNFCRAILNNAVVLVHGFGPLSVLENKSLFAVLSSQLFSYLFTSQEQKFLKTYIPHTTTKNLIQGGSIVEKEFFIQNKDKFVFKTTFSGAGLGVQLGKETTIDKWKILIENCQSDYIVQECITPMSIPLAIPSSKGMFETARFNNCMVFFNVQGNLYGVISRLSNSSRVNAMSGAYMQPVVVVSD
ncbi:hypothetical protein BH10PSE19_BH10PSE19_00960 [soil metagenome]